MKSGLLRVLFVDVDVELVQRRDDMPGDARFIPLRDAGDCADSKLVSLSLCGLSGVLPDLGVVVIFAHPIGDSCITRLAGREGLSPHCLPDLCVTNKSSSNMTL